MAARTYTDEERHLILIIAEEKGDKHACELFEVPDGTLRSWRHRAQRKVTDRRAAHSDPAPTSTGAGLVDVSIPDGNWDAARGCESKVPARARALERFKLGGELVSQRPLHHLGVPARDTAGLAAGHIILLGRRFASFSDRIWEVVERRGKWRDRFDYFPSQPRPYNEATGTYDGRPTESDPDELADYALLIVRPARLRAGTELSDDRARIVERDTAQPGWRGLSTAERLRLYDEQPPLNPAA